MAVVAAEFAVKTGFDPREKPNGRLHFRVRSQRIQVWPEANELVGRDVIRDGAWIEG